MNPYEDRLSRALDAEAEQLEPSPDALATILGRVGDEGSESAAVLQLEAGRRRRHVRNGVVAGVLAVGMAAAATIFAVSGGIKQDAVPQPGQTPIGTPTAPAPTPTDPDPTGTVTFDPPRPSVARTVYRVQDHPKQTGGLVGLFVEYVRNEPPYAPRQSLDALFSVPAVNQSNSAPLANGRNKVASTKETDAAIEVDLSQVDTQNDPQGTGSDAMTAAVYVQAWVYTIQDAYSSDKPVLFTLKGKPTTLYGQVDTARPISRDRSLKPADSYDIFLPRDGEKVTSPIDLTASAPAGDYLWRLVNLETGFKPDVAGQSGSGGFRSIGAIDLPKGRYRATMLSDPGTKTPSFKRSVTFTVTGDGTPPPSTSPQTDPPIGRLELTPVYFAGKEPGLIEEWRPKSSAESAVQTLFDGATGSDLVDRSAWQGVEVQAVTRIEKQIIVDVALPQSWPAGRLDPTAAQALASTAAGYFRSKLPVVLTYTNHSVPLASPGAVQDMKISQAAEPFQPISDTTVSSPVAIVGGLPDTKSTAIWYVSDGITDEPLFQGVAPVNAADRTYGFTLDLKPGRYNLTVATTSAKDRRMQVFSTFTVR
jgi:hypothetical protein